MHGQERTEWVNVGGRCLRIRHVSCVCGIFDNCARRSGVERQSKRLTRNASVTLRSGSPRQMMLLVSEPSKHPKLSSETKVSSEMVDRGTEHKYHSHSVHYQRTNSRIQTADRKCPRVGTLESN